MKNAVVAALVVLLAGAGGFLVYERWQQRPALTVTTLTPAPATAAPAEGVPSEAAVSKRVIPESVPDIALADLAGKAHSLHEFKGKPVVFNFWATWCAPCRREIPLLNQLGRDYAKEGLQVVGIAVDFKDDVAEYVKTTRLDYHLLVGEQDGLEAAHKFGMEMALPFSIFVDSLERIVAVKVGELHREDATAILEQVFQLDAKKTQLPQARAAISARLRDLALARSTR